MKQLNSIYQPILTILHTVYQYVTISYKLFYIHYTYLLYHY